MLSTIHSIRIAPVITPTLRLSIAPATFCTRKVWCEASPVCQQAMEALLQMTLQQSLLLFFWGRTCFFYEDRFYAAKANLARRIPAFGRRGEFNGKSALCSTFIVPRQARTLAVAWLFPGALDAGRSARRRAGEHRAPSLSLRGTSYDSEREGLLADLAARQVARALPRTWPLASVHNARPAQLLCLWHEILRAGRAAHHAHLPVAEPSTRRSQSDAWPAQRPCCSQAAQASD